MQKQRTHEQRVASLRRADFSRTVPSPFFDGTSVQFPVSVRARNHSQGAVAFVAIIKVQPHRQHPFQYDRRRVSVMNSILERPWTETRRVAPLSDGHGQILMPGDTPVRIKRLVEKQSTNSKSPFSKEKIYQSRYRFARGKFCNLRTAAQQITSTRPRRIQISESQRGAKSGQFLATDKPPLPNEAILIQRRHQTRVGPAHIGPNQ